MTCTGEDTAEGRGFPSVNSPLSFAQYTSPRNHKNYFLLTITEWHSVNVSPSKYNIRAKNVRKKTCFDMEINSKSVRFIMFSIWCWIRETFQCIDSAWMNSTIIFVWNQASSWAYFLVRVFIKLCCWGWIGYYLVYYICSKIWPSTD